MQPNPDNEYMSFDEFMDLFETDDEDLTPEQFDALMDQGSPVDVEVDLRRDNDA